jgi:hypothetical protein
LEITLLSQQELDQIAVPLSDCLKPITDQLADLCQCIKDYAQQPGSQPCNTFPFFFRGSVTQTAICHKASSLLQVPSGQTATVTQVAFSERYPGTLYGAHFMLMVNDNLEPTMPRIDHPMGDSIGTGAGTRICLQEQDILSVMIQCSWTPATFTGIAETYIQTLFPFEISGFYEYK